jgi:hypothetical protein
MHITSKIKVLRSPPGLILPERDPRRPEENEKTEKHAETDAPEVAGARARR